MPAIFFALISYFGWGTGVLIEAIAARRLSSYSIVFWGLILSSIVSSFYIPFAVHDLTGLTASLLILNIVLAVVGLFFGSFFYYEAMKVENRALVGTIASSFPMVSVILSIIFLGERVSLQQVIAILLIFAGILLTSINLKEIRSSKFSVSKGILFAVLAMLAWGAYFAFIKIPVDKIGWFWPNYITYAIFPLVFLYLRIGKKKIEKPTLNNALAPIVVSTILVRIAEFSYNLGISRSLVAVVAPIAGASPTLFVVLAFLIFKDPITRQQIVGIITTLIGIVLLSIFSA